MFSGRAEARLLVECRTCLGAASRSRHGLGEGVRVAKHIGLSAVQCRTPMAAACRRDCGQAW
eukprot:353460-Chlamydomonas_euryale.AAC.22